MPRRQFRYIVPVIAALVAGASASVARADVFEFLLDHPSSFIKIGEGSAGIEVPSSPNLEHSVSPSKRDRA